MACASPSVQQIGDSTNCPLKDNNNPISSPPKMTNTNTPNFSTDLPEGQVKGQPGDLAPGCPKSASVCSQLVSDLPKGTPENLKPTTTTTNNNINNSNITNSSSSGGGSSMSSSSCKNSSCNNSVLATVTKVVRFSDEEQEAFLAEIDSDLPNFLSRTFMGQDARFSFILFFTVFSFSLVLGLFVIQASYAWHNYQLLEMLGREDFSEEFFYLHYYDPPEPLTDETPSPGLRVNTSFYVH